MTPKEKAEELVEKFKFETKRSEIVNDLLLGDISVVFKHYKAKQCALIAVDEIISSSPSLPILGDSGIYGEDIELSTKYWEDVKQEIESYDRSRM
jgi:hypothetical protein